MKTISLITNRYLPIILFVIVIVAIASACMLWSQGNTTTDRLFIAHTTEPLEKNKDVSFNIRLLTKTPVDTVTATVGYNPDTLQYKDTTYTGSPFNSHIPAITEKSNSVTIQVAKLGGTTVSGDVIVASLLFSVKEDNAKTPVLTAGNSAHAGVALSPFIKNKLPLSVILLGVLALALSIVVVCLLLNRKKVAKGKS